MPSFSPAKRPSNQESQQIDELGATRLAGLEPDASRHGRLLGAPATAWDGYRDERRRVYEMSIDDREWRLWREGEPFPQRFTGRFEDGGNTIAGRWDKAEDGESYETDFDLIYRKLV